MIPPLLIVGAGVLALLVRDHLRTPWDAFFEEAGGRWNVDPNLLRAIGRKESQFKATAMGTNKNGTHDYGVMQINNTNLSHLGLTTTSALDPRKNIDAGAKLLAEMRREFGSLYTYRSIVSAYNVGVPRVKSSGIVNEPYVTEVTYHHKLYALGRMFS